jgi:uncharacterized membrane protein YhaH (DUF805 family)
MNFYSAIKSGFENYGQFDGRSSRSEYWWFYLLGVIFGQFLNFSIAAGPSFVWLSWIAFFMGIVIIIPSLSVGVRRLHDVNKSGWNWLLVFTIIGIIPLLIWLARPGATATNRFGPSPKTSAIKSTSHAFTDRRSRDVPQEESQSIDFDKLEKLAALYKSGALTEAEFVQQKEILLKRGS